MSYRVSTQVYSGPFDLLLQLVTRQKVDIGAISISEVAEQYLAEVERIEALDLDVASDFLLVAATLLDIKAASLVPQEAPRNTDEDDDEDLEELSALDGDALREVLIQRLIAYKQFKGAAAVLGARMQAESRMHPRVAGPTPSSWALCPTTWPALPCAAWPSSAPTWMASARPFCWRPSTWHRIAYHST
jgi:condensin subunit ScpA